MNRPQENQFPCRNADFRDGDEYYLIKNMRYMVALSDYMDDLENRIEALEKALDRACFCLSKYVDYDFSPNITLEMEIRNKSAVEIEREYWKDFLITGHL